MDIVHTVRGPKGPLTWENVPEVGLEPHSSPCKHWEVAETCRISASPAGVRTSPGTRVWTMSTLVAPQPDAFRAMLGSASKPVPPRNVAVTVTTAPPQVELVIQRHFDRLGAPRSSSRTVRAPTRPTDPWPSSTTTTSPRPLRPCPRSSASSRLFTGVAEVPRGARVTRPVHHLLQYLLSHEFRGLIAMAGEPPSPASWLPAPRVRAVPMTSASRILTRL